MKNPGTTDAEYRDCIHELIKNPTVDSMKQFMQHGETSCYEHCALVSYYSYRLCRRLRLDSRSAARAGMLHDLFLYDWHDGTPYRGLHGYHHARVALFNAEKCFELNPMERDIIQKHMWPLTAVPPRYRESLIVSCVDKYCTFVETARLRRFLSFDGRPG
ncbi:MAG: HD family phosphohydrolase [Clostridia bacterium]|nr:HD family phosphohydrolase [Clostridia bacterium]MDR3644501.1 HD family phosphohydrolase [Clostridia bacterium]